VRRGYVQAIPSPLFEEVTNLNIAEIDLRGVFIELLEPESFRSTNLVSASRLCLRETRETGFRGQEDVKRLTEAMTITHED
jgi:hypothetical protein